MIALAFPTIADATLWEVDTERSYVDVYNSWGGYNGSLTVMGFFETEIEGNQLAFIRRDVTIMGDEGGALHRDLVFPDYPATMGLYRFEGRKVLPCTGMPDITYVGYIVEDQIWFDGRSHWPVCGNDVFSFVYRIVGRQFQPRDIPQLHIPGVLVFISLIGIFGFLFLGRYR
jgi:hypothetical protein